MDAALSLVAPYVLTSVAPGLGGGTNRISERVALTVGERVSHRCPSVLQPRFVLTETTFDLRRL